jgi:hypothetical protein
MENSWWLEYITPVNSHKIASKEKVNRTDFK